MARETPQPQDSVIPGTMPRSQAVSTYGIGSVYELRSHHSGGPVLHSVMIAGLDWWPPSSTLLEPDLARSLGVRHFRKPPVDSETWEHGGAIPAVRFPKWLSCSKCNRLGRVPREFDDIGLAGPRCKAAGCKGKGVPVRLVVTCFRSSADQGDDDQPGHIDDFPWVWWAHSQKGRTCSSPQLKLETERNTTSLSGLTVRCYSDECKGEVWRSLDGVFGEYALNGIRCSGERPWCWRRHSLALAVEGSYRKNFGGEGIKWNPSPLFLREIAKPPGQTSVEGRPEGFFQEVSLPRNAHHTASGADRLCLLAAFR